MKYWTNIEVSFEADNDEDAYMVASMLASSVKQNPDAYEVIAGGIELSEYQPDE